MTAMAEHSCRTAGTLHIVCPYQPTEVRRVATNRSKVSDYWLHQPAWPFQTATVFVSLRPGSHPEQRGPICNDEPFNWSRSSNFRANTVCASFRWGPETAHQISTSYGHPFEDRMRSTPEIFTSFRRWSVTSQPRFNFLWSFVRKLGD